MFEQIGRHALDCIKRAPAHFEKTNLERGTQAQ
jgi:hypothetical protein